MFVNIGTIHTIATLHDHPIVDTRLCTLRMSQYVSPARCVCIYTTRNAYAYELYVSQYDTCQSSDFPIDLYAHRLFIVHMTYFSILICTLCFKYSTWYPVSRGPHSRTHLCICIPAGMYHILIAWPQVFYLILSVPYLTQKRPDFSKVTCKSIHQGLHYLKVQCLMYCTTNS